MSTPIVISDSAIEAMAARRAHRADPGDLRDVVFAAIEATPPRRRSLTWRPVAVPALAWAMLLVGLLLALVVGGLLAGRWRPDQAIVVAPSPPVAPAPSVAPGSAALVPTGIEVLTPESTGYDRVVVDGKGTYWAIGRGHLTRFDPATGERKTWTVSDDAAFGGEIAGPAAAGGVWIAPRTLGETQVLRFDGTAFRDGIPLSCIDLVFGTSCYVRATADGTVWNNRSYWDGAAWVDPPAEGPVGYDFVFGPGEMWSTDGNDPTAVWHLSGGRWTRHGLPVDVPDGHTSMTVGADGSVWVTALGPNGNSRGRILHFDKRTWTVMAGPVAGGRSGERQLEVAPDGSLWAAVEDRVARYSGGRWTTYTDADGLVGAPGIAPISATPAGVLVATDRGVARFAGDRFVPVWSDPQVGPWWSERIAAISRDEAWVAGYAGDGVLWHYRDGRWDGPTAPADLPGLPLPPPDSSIRDPSIRALAVGPDGAPWVVKGDGVAVLRGGTWRSTRVGSRANALAVDPSGTAWVPAGDGSTGEVIAVSSDLATPVRRVRCPNTADSLAAASDGSVYVAGQARSPTQPPGLSRIVGTSCTAVDVMGDGRGHDVQGILAGSGNRLVAIVSAPPSYGTPEEVTPNPGSSWATMLFDATRWTEIERGEPSYLFFDPQGRLWRLRDGFSQFDGARWIAPGPDKPAWFGDDSLAFENVSIAPDGTFWFIGPSGVARIVASR